ncbi:MAG TPA: winged helix DNA-binding domain-containing protein [Candidatus Dormibacteraeota bacterium]|nr:winged helix DNA-binding domain-containing protein [Candidatus Dormibacteraeota bacterium]
MTSVAVRRLGAQRLTGEPFSTPVEAVRWLGAVQSQDYAGAKWALGQRTRAARDADLDRLFDEGTILRTHVMRPTWHFVLPADVRWLLELTAPRVRAALAHYDRQLELDRSVLRRSHRVLESVLGGGSHLTRGELAAALAGSGIPAAGQRLGHLLMHAELDAVVVSGPRRGRQFTYALLDERAPGARRLDRDEALGELTLRYFSGHGPAQAPDFAWWSGLTVADARRGLALAGSALVHEVIDGRSYWSSPGAPPAVEGGPVGHLLPNYDEFLVAYRDRTAALDPERPLDTTPFPGGSILAHVVALDGQVRGGWKRRLHRGQVVVELGPLDALEAAEAAALHRAAAGLARFLDLPVTVAGAPGAGP